jgi:hypothetical protein
MKRKSGRGCGRPARGHIKVQFNIHPEISRMIDLGAAREEITRSQYIENLVETVTREAQERTAELGLAKKILRGEACFYRTSLLQ